MAERRQVQHFNDINECHAAMGFTGRTDLPDFHVYTIAETYPSTREVMPPYTLRFYCLSLHEQAADGQLEVNAYPIIPHNDTLGFQPPGHISAWVRGAQERGYLLYFQPEFLLPFATPLAEVFPFFRATEVNVLSLTPADKGIMTDAFARLILLYGRPHPYRVPLLQHGLMQILFECQSLYERAPRSLLTETPTLVTRFRQAVEGHYLTHQRVQEYADLLGVTAHYLSQAVSTSLGQRAYDVIMARVLVEAKKLLRYTDLPQTEIAIYLGFRNPTHFTRWFKRYTSQTPSAYRQPLPH